MRSEVFDVAIVGAGINGLMTAWNLSARGIRRIAIVERGNPGDGASTRGNGLLRTHHADWQETRFAVESLAFYRDASDTLGTSIGFQQSGFLWMVGADEVGRLETLCKANREQESHVVLLHRDDLAELQPQLDLNGIEAAAYEPFSGNVDPALLINAVALALHRRGIAFFPGAAVTSLQRSAGTVTGFRTAQGSFAAGEVVVAAGAATGALLETAGISLPIRPKTVYGGSCFLDRPTRDWIPFLDSAHRLFAMPRDGYVQIAVGPGSAPTYDDGEDSSAADLERLDQGLARIGQRIPGMTDARYARIWSGVDGFTDDNKGVYGRAPGVDGLSVIAGASQKGLKVAPAVARQIADLIVTGTDPFADGPFCAHRFTGMHSTGSATSQGYTDLE